VLQLYSFDYGYSLVVLGKDFLSWSGGEGKRIIYYKCYSPSIAFHVLTTIKLIYTFA
jgi:hypothetical protein